MEEKESWKLTLYKQTLDFVAPTKSNRIVSQRNSSILKHSGELVEIFQMSGLDWQCYLLHKLLVRNHYFQMHYHNITM
jgi:hypothetical protein